MLSKLKSLFESYIEWRFYSGKFECKSHYYYTIPTQTGDDCDEGCHCNYNMDCGKHLYCYSFCPQFVRDKIEEKRYKELLK